MKLFCKKIKSHTCLEIFQSTNDTNRRRHGVLFQSFSEAVKCRGTERKLIENGPKVNYSTEKVIKNFFLEWPNGR